MFIVQDSGKTFKFYFYHCFHHGRWNTTCSVKNENNEAILNAESHCDTRDHFVKKIGREKAIHKLLETIGSMVKMAGVNMYPKITIPENVLYLNKIKPQIRQAFENMGKVKIPKSANSTPHEPNQYTVAASIYLPVRLYKDGESVIKAHSAKEAIKRVKKTLKEQYPECTIDTIELNGTWYENKGQGWWPTNSSGGHKTQKNYKIPL